MLKGAAWWPPEDSLGRAGQSAPLGSSSGTTTLAGHVWVGQSPGVLARLHQVVPGNLVELVDGSARSRFVVTDVEQVARDRLPGWVWRTREGARRLVLVTCAGRAVDADGHRVWSQNLIVTATALGQQEGVR
ncbi:class F sortase [Acidipropionibacterium timonense]|uniref:class F sortase n=1 Tax=Acidipropionibacterium timonense TaxID=2161818 RepID=UPI001FD90D2D|nr:class F sortase [Acidipropionibacterium timonense]